MEILQDSSLLIEWQRMRINQFQVLREIMLVYIKVFVVFLAYVILIMFTTTVEKAISNLLSTNIYVENRYKSIYHYRKTRISFHTC